MAGALLLEDDVNQLVQRYGDVALPEALLSRLSEMARLMAVRERIRSSHEADCFELYKHRRGGHQGSKRGKNVTVDNSMPAFMERMLRMMKVECHDQVFCLNGFSSIDATVKFSFEVSPHVGINNMRTDVKGPIYLHFRFRREPLGTSGSTGWVNGGDEPVCSKSRGTRNEIKDRNDGGYCPKNKDGHLTGDGKPVLDDKGNARGCRKRKRPYAELTELGSRDAAACSDDESEESQLGLDPRTLVSYTISSEIDFQRPETLLQAVVYACESGPASIMKPKDDGDTAAIRDEEDSFDCHVDTEALSRVGRALGIHGVSPLQVESGKGAEPFEEDFIDGLTTEDMIWWLLMFPFYEREFDMVDVVISSVLGGEGHSDDDSNSGSSSEWEILKNMVPKHS